MRGLTDAMPSRALLHDLKAFAVKDARVPADPDGAFVTSFVTRSRERIAALEAPVAGLVVVLEGSKELHHAARTELFRPGEAIALRAGWRGDVVNTPDPATGTYRALCLGFPADLMLRVRRNDPTVAGAPRPGLQTRVACDDVLASAVLHAAAGLQAAGTLPRGVVEHRLAEVLLVLAARGVLPVAPERQAAAAAEAVRLLVRGRLDRSWTAAAAAAALGLSEATLRRRLAAENSTFAKLLRAERMAAADALIAEGLSVAQASEATGYSSRSHFGRQFRTAFQRRPNERRRRPEPAQS